MKASDNRSMLVRWTKKEEAVIVKNYGKSTYAQIAVMLPERTWMAVRHRARLLGLTGRSNLGRRYSADRGFFSTPNILNSYWAGFLAADGNVLRRRLSLGLALKDGTHVERLREALGYTGKIYRGHKVIRIQITCPCMVMDLQRNFNITEKKSLTLRPPPLTNEALVRAFIVGVIDGDGSITMETKRGKYLHPRITVYGTLALLQWIRQYFDLWVPAHGRKPAAVHKRPTGELYSYRVTAGRANAIGHILLSVDVPRLARKWNIIDTKERG
jgi:hypothetical protein